MHRPASVYLRVPRTLYLRSHVFVCQAQRHWVILDVSRDKYFCVDRRQFESLGPRIRGWEDLTAHSASVAGARLSEALADSLLSLGILSEHAVAAKDARAIVYPHPTDAVDSDSGEIARSSWWVHGMAFFLSCAKAARQLRNERFEAIIGTTQASKARARNPAAGFDVEAARPLLASFDRLRWFYPRPYLCLFDSLAQIHFLGCFGLYPDWVFGVKADPFEAHCWVQSGGIVLNDTVGRVSAFTPIMYV